ncbi:hypothetical protein ACFV2S_26030 [Streptomyces sp. NPDC059695]|uniref:imine reductase family protein n=1 Tax=Streptomyces sp. NPDC059695 TaxID=3346910 RepID=UPI0036C444C3
MQTEVEGGGGPGAGEDRALVGVEHRSSASCGRSSAAGVQVATIGHLLHAGEVRGVDGRLPRLHLELMRSAVEAGHGGDSYARIIEVFRT